MIRLKNLIKSLTPPILLHLIRHFTHKATWGGNYKSWDQALALCSGYNSPDILQKVSLALKKVRAGEASYERDSVLFFKPLDHSGVLCSLLYSSIKEKVNITVFDFGGSLGSTYFQFKPIFKSLSWKIDWNVLEQAHFVELGNQEFHDESLSFFSDISKATNIKPGSPKVLIMSASLQYLENPYEKLNELLDSTNFQYVIMARIPFHFEDGSRLTIQTVPPEIYTASYPCWFFNETEFLAHFSTKFRLVTELSTPDTCHDFPSFFKGFLFERNHHESKI